MAVNYSVHCIVSVVRLFSKLSISYERILYVTLGPLGSEVLRSSLGSNISVFLARGSPKFIWLNFHTHLHPIELLDIFPIQE